MPVTQRWRQLPPGRAGGHQARPGAGKVSLPSSPRCFVEPHRDLLPRTSATPGDVCTGRWRCHRGPGRTGTPAPGCRPGQPVGPGTEPQPLSKRRHRSPGAGRRAFTGVAGAPQSRLGSVL